MKILFTIILTLFCFVSFAQQEKNIGFYLSPNYASRTNLPDYSSSEGKIGWHLGMGGYMSLKSGKWFFGSGLKLSKFGERNRRGTNTFITGIMIENGTTTTIDQALLNLEQVEFIDQYYYLGVPINVKYLFGAKTVKFFVQSGLETSFFIKGTHEVSKFFLDGTVENETSSGNLFSFRSLNWLASFSIGIEVPLQEKISLSFQPNWQMHVLSTSKNGGIDGSRLFSIGTQIGIQYKMD